MPESDVLSGEDHIELIGIVFVDGLEILVETLHHSTFHDKLCQYNSVNNDQLNQLVNLQFQLSNCMLALKLGAKKGMKTASSSNQTLYLSNLNQKIPTPQLKATIRETFEEFGQILDIIAKRNILMRGQAFIIFKDINSAMEAMTTLAGKEFLGKPLKIDFARAKSKLIAQIQGTPIPVPKPADYFSKKYEQKFVHRKVYKRERRPEEKNAPLAKLANQPHHTLFVEGIKGISQESLITAFQRFGGFVEVRLIAPKGVAFVQFEDEIRAGVAMAGLNSTQIEGIPLNISYAKK